MFKFNGIHRHYLENGRPQSTGEMVQALRHVRDKRGLAHLSYFQMSSLNPESNIRLITSCDERWVELYFKRRYFEIDPVTTVARNLVVPMHWSQQQIASPAIEELYRESWGFGVGRNGLTVRIRGDNGDLGLVSLSVNASEHRWLEICDQLACELMYFAALCYNDAQNVLSAAVGNKRSILTPREKEVIGWAAKGKSAWETSRIIGVTERTVSSYMASVYSKLGVSSKAHAVAKVLSQGIENF